MKVTNEQLEELRRFADGKPHAPAERPNRNLIRRNLLTLVPGGIGAYRITPLGASVLADSPAIPLAPGKESE